VCPRDATPLEDAPEDEDPLIGATLSESYEIVGVLGEGGMGRVYRARHRRLPNKQYAIKMLHHDLARQPEVVARFQREAEAVAALEHPNIVGVYDVNSAPDGRPYLVQELLEGVELAAHLDRVGRLPPASAVAIVRQICHALGAAHARGIVHRDVKPENVILMGDLATPTVKMLDFGISKVAEAETALTKTGVVMGTPAYMAPEQARGDRVDARADIYAVGAILYRAVTGRKPFEGLEAMATLTAVLVEEPPRPRSLEQKVPEALELVIQRAMAKSSAERPATMAELDAALADLELEHSGAVSPVDRTLLAASPPVPGLRTTARSAYDAKRARPALVVFSLLGAGTVLALTADAVLSALRWITDVTRGPTLGELVLSAVIAAVLSIAPSVLWIRFLVKSVWKNTPRAMEIADRARTTLVAGASLYALGTVAVRAFELVVARDPAGLAWPGWTLLIVALTGLGAVGAWFASARRAEA